MPLEDWDWDNPFGRKSGRKSSHLVQKEEDEMTAQPLILKEGFTIGADPEMFCRDPNGVAVPAADCGIPGTKAKPHKVDGGAVQVDGMAAEYNIDPVSDFKEWNANHQKVIKQLESFLPKGYTLDAVSAVEFDQDVFDKASEEAKELGCSPDFNAWTRDINPPPSDPDNPTLRCAGAHIHVGWTKGEDTSDVQHVLNCCDLVQQFDWYLGAPSLKMSSDPRRRRLYGKAGSCRIKDYGVEYRVLDNFWIMTRDRRLWVWNRLCLAINRMQKHFIPEKVSKTSNIEIQKSIDESTLSPSLRVNFKYPIMTTDSNYARFGI